MGTLADLEKKVAQLFVVGVPGTTLSVQEQKTLERIGPGGYILFKHNIESVDQVVQLNNSLLKVSDRGSWRNMPSWISVDQEGGRVQRVREPATLWPPAKLIGQLDSPKTAYEAGFAVASELHALGFNVNYAPVLDVPSDWNNPALGDRCFSTDPEIVASMGSAFLRGVQRAGVLAVAKHFAGHGGVNVDSHLELPVCHTKLAELQEKDWVPFRRAIRARVEGVMTAHVLYTDIDAERPATLSRRLLQDHLRKELRFGKLIFTDDLGMGAITQKYSLEEAVFLSIEAGCDQLLLCHNFDELEAVWVNIVRAFESGALPKAKLDEALTRIGEAKKKWLSPVHYADAGKAKKILGCAEHQKIAEAILLQRPLEGDIAET
ncbi:MAG TPA: beta-N-acetylhexosaminidase [Bdellovibrionota bacterium]|nr:beta-N-acetylhexosaminidase [Bdellovibrionota bacterium]